MSKTPNKILREEFNRLKKALERMISPKNKQAIPQLVVQPVRPRKY